MPQAGLAGYRVAHLVVGFVAILMIHSMMSNDIDNKRKYAKLEMLMKGSSPKPTTYNDDFNADSRESSMENEVHKGPPTQDSFHYTPSTNAEHHRNYQKNVPHEMQGYFKPPTLHFKLTPHSQYPFQQSAASQQCHHQPPQEKPRPCPGRYASGHANSETIPLDDSYEDSSHSLGHNDDLEQETIEQMKRVFNKHPKYHLDKPAYKIIVTPVTDIEINMEDIRKKVNDTKDEEEKDTLKNLEDPTMEEENILDIINGLGKNYASKDFGAAICNVKAEPLVKPNLIHKFFGLEYLTNLPVYMIKDQLEFGCCFAFTPPEASVVIKLSDETPVRKILIEHVPRSRNNNFKIDNAPKDFLVYGSNMNKRGKVYFLGSFTFELKPGNAPQYQIFETQVYDANFTHINVIFESNHGNPNVTCVYRFGVYNPPVIA